MSPWNRGKKKECCLVCSKPEHRIVDCWYNTKSKKYNSLLESTPEITRNLKKRRLIDISSSGVGSGQIRECEFTFMVQHVDDILRRWFLDSCASLHLRNQCKHFVDYKSLRNDEFVNAACEETSVRVRGAKNIRVRQVIDGVETNSLLKDVRYASKCRTNLISLSKAQNPGIGVYFEPGSTKMIAKCKGRTVMVGDSTSTGIAKLKNMRPVQSGSKASCYLLQEKTMKCSLLIDVRATLELTSWKSEETNAAHGLRKLKSTKKIVHICEACVDGKATSQPHLRREKSTRRYSS